jgi:hypothetical protein
MTRAITLRLPGLCVSVQRKTLRRAIILFIANVAIIAGLASASAENAFNPLAAVNSTDLRLQPTTSNSRDKVDLCIDGPYMLTPKHKLKCELHYDFTDITGTDQSGLELVLDLGHTS